MKKFILKSFSVAMAIVLLTTQSQILSAKPLDSGIPSMDESAFCLNEEVLDEKMSELNALDDFVSEEAGITYADLEEMGSDLIANVSDLATPMGASGSDDDLMGIPAFWWGCVLGWVGILLVYLLTDQDKEQTKKALWGCLVWTGVVAVFYVIYIALLVEEVNTIYY
jgi:hypothetical protein